MFDRPETDRWADPPDWDEPACEYCADVGRLECRDCHGIGCETCDHRGTVVCEHCPTCPDCGDRAAVGDHRRCHLIGEV